MSHRVAPKEAVPASLLSRWIMRPLAWLGGAVSALLIIAMLGITIYAIFMRYVMNQPLLWADEVTGWALVAIVMLGVAEAHRQGDHISIDLLTARASGARRLFGRILSECATLGFAGVVGWSVWESINFARSFGSYTSGNIVIETWILQTPILIGCCLLALVAAVRVIELILGADGR